MLQPTVDLLPASQFSLDALTAAYNQTRVDYLVPMPMNAERLRAYITGYDVSLEDSLVAVDGSQILGLAMLGVRQGRTWITRLGVLPVQRRHGAGESLMRGLIAASERLGYQRIILEVIAGNEPAHQLFLKVGFQPTRNLLVLRRAPGKSEPTSAWRMTWLDQEDALDLLQSQAGRDSDCCRLPWTNEVESLRHEEDVLGVMAELEMGARGWMVFRRQKRLISHFIFHTEKGDPAQLAGAILSHLYQRFPFLDSYVENIATEDKHLPAMTKMGFFEAFGRLEMVRKTKDS